MISLLKACDTILLPAQGPGSASGAGSLQDAALSSAKYMIQNNGDYAATVPGLQGVWATGKTVEGARTELVEVIEGWIAVRLRSGLPIPSIGNRAIEASAEPIASV